jgi:murein DD-endopeptidase MepM/ murein hydrolase activator NlpD
MGAVLLYLLTFKVAAALDLPIMRDMVSSATADAVQQRERQLRDRLNAIAVRLGEVQAQVTRLDAVGARVTGLLGIKPQDFGFGAKPARGGAAPDASSRDANVQDLQRELELLASDTQLRASSLDRLESTILDRDTAKRLTPSSSPVSDALVLSGFGWRYDPFTGQRTMHAGQDFSAPIGTPVYAAAGGVVTTVEVHPEYGNVIEVDHGNGLVTRYAHASKILANVGDIIKPGQQIALVGMSGRATGPHLHFEVHKDGTAMDPAKFLGTRALQAALVSPK